MNSVRAHTSTRSPSARCARINVGPGVVGASRGSGPASSTNGLQRHGPLKRKTQLPRGKPLRRVGARGRVTREVLAQVRPLVLARDGHRCRRCKDPRCRPLDMHHVRARSQGGTHTLANLVTLGRRCHELVTTHRAPDWRRWVSTRKGGTA